MALKPTRQIDILNPPKNLGGVTLKVDEKPTTINLIQKNPISPSPLHKHLPPIDIHELYLNYDDFKILSIGCIIFGGFLKIYNLISYEIYVGLILINIGLIYAVKE